MNEGNRIHETRKTLDHEGTLSMSNETKPFKEWVSSLASQIDEGTKNLDPDERQHWLRSLHHDFTLRFMHDNSRIFGTGAILIPVSLAGFAIPVQADTINLLPLIILGLGSILLLALWNIMANSHRAFQEAHRAWICAVQELLGIKDTPDKISDLYFFPVHRARQALPWLVFVGWLVVWIWAAVKPVAAT